ncbi:MAG TPA: class I SAM-dependent methyltransferase, partial [Chroococcales cyanobacterium]
MSNCQPSSAQIWSADGYAKNARYVADLGQAVLSLLSPQPGERVLDIGCGDGALTEKIAACGARVVGVDSSAELLKAARERGLDVHLMDAQALRFDDEFDAVFSNAALHWMTEPASVVRGVGR